MVSANLTQKPNTPIFLEETTITHIAGQRLPRPCSDRITIHLSSQTPCCNPSLYLASMQVDMAHINNPRKGKAK